jgi:glycosyltransferase involved in cell wall biosynthesis/SAM-dependent methyltransferase
MRSVSVVIPVKDGARFLPELLDALEAERPDEILVIDSGSTDGSLELVRERPGVRLLEIAPEEFGHGRTRNLGAAETTGDVIAFLTQDATPQPGWLDALRAGFGLAERVGAVYGPHVPRPDTSPMIARELEEFFSSHSPSGEPIVQRDGDVAFLSNVNAAYLRECWEQLRFDDVQYAEDAAFGRSMLAAGWAKVFHPGMRVAHAHDYPPVQFMRRYFDEYRGLHRTIGHVEGIGVRSTYRFVKGSVGADRRWMDENAVEGLQRMRWTARSAIHHGGRKVFSALGSRADRLPGGVQRRISLEGTGAAAPAHRPSPLAPAPIPAGRVSAWEPMLRVARDGPAPLRDGLPGMSEREHLHIAVVIPPFRRGSGGHNSIFQMLSRLERAGHTVSIWLHDPQNWQGAEWAAVVRRNVSDYFAPFEGPVFKGFDDWYGADVVVATGWDTVHPALLLDDVLARVYLVHDHEPEFHATGALRWWAEQTYSFGLHTICASPWLADIVRERYGGTASLFDFGVDHDVYHPRDIERRRDTVVFYGRDATPRRAVPLGILALEELHRRRPDLRFVMFGDSHPGEAPFPYEHLGIASPDQLAYAYSEATVGLVLSMTNYSLIPQEMLACGLPCVDLAGFSAETVFGADGPVELAPFDPLALADAMERLIDDPALWERRSASGRSFVDERTWDHAAGQVEAGIREALRLREQEFGAPDVDPDGFVRTPAQLGYGSAPPPGFDASARSVPFRDHSDMRPVTDALFARLSDADVADVLEALDAEQRALHDAATPAERRTLTLHFGVWHRIAAVLEKTGLTADEPPEAVHAMARGAVAAGGDHYSADMVVEALGGSLDGVRSALDFGSSSGRLLRSLSAAFPAVEWHGVDPNADAVTWAAEHVRGVAFAVSPTDPPLGFADGALDLVSAISIWSHFDEGAALRWLGEMHRVIAPGGRLVMTVHGMRSIEYASHAATRPPRQLEEIRRALYRRGFWFAPEFGTAGDHGVAHPEWGTSFMTPEWLLRQATPAWAVERYEVGRNLGNQDLVVLRRA